MTEGEKVSFLRYRGSKINKIKELDAFPKIPEPYVKTSPVGGTCKTSSFYVKIQIKFFFYFSVSV